MELIDKYVYSQVIGCLMAEPKLLIQYPDISQEDFGDKTVKIIFLSILNLVRSGKIVLSPADIDIYIQQSSTSTIIFNQNKGSEFLVDAYSNYNMEDFEYHYRKLKKLSLLRVLKKNNYDIGDYYKNEFNSIKEERETIERFENSSIEEILNAIEQKYTIIRNAYLNNGSKRGDPSEGIDQLIERLRSTPAIGAELLGDIFSMVTRGARKGCYYLKAASTSCGKTRTSVFDACKVAFPEHYSFNSAYPTFVVEKDMYGNPKPAEKVLFIVTEMDKEELQTIMLAHLSGVNEYHILTGMYEMDEYDRVRKAAKIIQKYKDYFYVEEISDPNLTNVEAVIKRYAMIEKVEYVFFDYIHSTGSLLGQFTKSGVGEHTMLMMLSNQLKQLAKDLDIFVFSATQVNATGMSSEDCEFKNETCIRGSKAIADKADCGYVMTKVNEKLFNCVRGKITSNAQLMSEISTKRHKEPTHVLDVYKMRQGQFKNVRIWTWLDLGTGEREDLFMTDADNNPITSYPEIGKMYTEIPEADWRKDIL